MLENIHFLLATCNFLEERQKKLPADHFVCEKYSLHLGVPDMVAALILNDLEKMRQNAKKVNILSRKKTQQWQQRGCSRK